MEGNSTSCLPNAAEAGIHSFKVKKEAGNFTILLIF